MFHDHDMTGRSFAGRTLCLTFDDGPGVTSGPGPGPRTAELAAYLHGEGIAATFFVTGRHGRLYPEVLEQIASLGHQLGNHGFDHVSLPSLLDDPMELMAQVTRTAAVLAPWTRGRIVPFRPPYGAWREGGAVTSTVAAHLNRSSVAIDHLGPVHWDIAPADWWYWRHERSVDQCAEAYLRDIAAAGRGIVLLHDSTADDDALRARNRTYELVRRLVPLLMADGYRFVPLDARTLWHGST